MGRSQESFHKKEVKSKKDKKRKEKEQKKLAKKDNPKSSSLEDMMAYVDENGMITDTPPDPTKKTVVTAESITIGIPKRDDTISDDPIRKGVVLFYNDSKGFGFIKDSETQESIFVHANNLLEAIKENNMVTFEVMMGPKGPAATQVKIIR
ncbi:MAG: cold shock domain-containing protein [Bacteroidetes bacterium]|nr:cold shock domain-containing protein [Bacteroidota bacterium]